MLAPIEPFAVFEPFRVAPGGSQGPREVYLACADGTPFLCADGRKFLPATEYLVVDGAYVRTADGALIGVPI